MLRHAWHRSQFYRDLYSASGIKEHDLPTLRPEDPPTVDKKLLMEHWDRVVTDLRLVKDALFRRVDQVADPELDYLAATTGETERVAHIPADPKTGKHRQVVQEG